mmetsp:Transcript_16146/g.19390  ORF Transcript_16146/g.19390 Transcript_16146/m.19390 type:complete len:119 (+) Transcript_16146:336-692(+)
MIWRDESSCHWLFLSPALRCGVVRGQQTLPFGFGGTIGVAFSDWPLKLNLELGGVVVYCILSATTNDSANNVRLVRTEIEIREVGSVHNRKRGSGLFPNPKFGKWVPCSSEDTALDRP